MNKFLQNCLAYCIGFVAFCFLAMLVAGLQAATTPGIGPETDWFKLFKRTADTAHLARTNMFADLAPTPGQVYVATNVNGSGNFQTVAGGGGSVSTNGNQFLGVPLAVKDGAFFTNANNYGAATIKTGGTLVLEDAGLLVNRALIYNGSRVVTVLSAIDTNELGHLDGVTGNIQGQFTAVDNKIVTTSNTFVGAFVGKILGVATNLTMYGNTTNNGAFQNTGPVDFGSYATFHGTITNITGRAYNWNFGSIDAGFVAQSDNGVMVYMDTAINGNIVSTNLSGDVFTIWNGNAFSIQTRPTETTIFGHLLLSSNFVSEFSNRFANVHFVGGEIPANSLLRSDDGTNLAPVTIGANLSFDGVTLSATGGGGSGSTNPVTLAAGTFHVTNYTTWRITNAGTATNLVADWSGPSYFRAQLTNHTTITLTNPPALGTPARSFTLEIAHLGGPSNLTVQTAGPIPISWRDGVGPNIGAGQTNYLDLWWNGTNVVGFSRQDLETGTGLSVRGTGPTITGLKLTGHNAAVGRKWQCTNNATGEGQWVDDPRVGVYRTISVGAAALWTNLTSGASLKMEETVANFKTRPYLEFSGSLTNVATFSLPMPEAWDRGNVSFKLYWSSTNALANKTNSWAIATALGDDDDAIDNAYGTEVVTYDPISALNDWMITSAMTPVPGGSADAAGAILDLRLRRLPDDTRDNMEGVAKLYYLVIRYFETTTEPGGAW